MIFSVNTFIFFVTIIKLATLNKVPEVTLPVEARVQLLKDAINQDIHNKKFKDNPSLLTRIKPVDHIDEGADYEYEDEGKITPIMENDDRKIRGRNALKRLKTKQTTPSVKRTKKINNSMRNNDSLTVKALSGQPEVLCRFLTQNLVLPVDQVDISSDSPAKKKDKRSGNRIPNLRFKDVFYRRYLSDIPSREREYLHCIDLITPFLRGHKKNMTDVKRLQLDNGVVMRLNQLLTEAAIGLSRDDIHSVMYQISNLQIRLFQWDITSMKLLLYSLTHERDRKSYSFKHIKYGLKKLFDAWQLDLSNTTNLLKQARIFRPPCMVITPNIGSTKSPSSTSYTIGTTKRAKISCLEYSNERDRKKCTSYYD